MFTKAVGGNGKGIDQVVDGMGVLLYFRSLGLG